MMSTSHREDAVTSALREKLTRYRQACVNRDEETIRLTSTLLIATLLILVTVLSAMIVQNLRKRQSIAPLPPLEPLPAPANDHLAAHSPTLKPFDAVHWAQMNEWLFEG